METHSQERVKVVHSPIVENLYLFNFINYFRTEMDWRLNSLILTLININSMKASDSCWRQTNLTYLSLRILNSWY